MFYRNNCKVPSEKDIENSTPTTGADPDGQKRRECYDQISNKARTDVEICVQQKLPGFKFPVNGDKEERYKVYHVFVYHEIFLPHF